jgi:hypothetical protein
MSWKATKFSTEMKVCAFIQGRMARVLLLLLVVAAGCVACASTDPDNQSEKPWNSPEGWQGGSMMPLQMNQPH